MKLIISLTEIKHIMFEKHIWKGIAAVAIIGTSLVACTKDTAPKKELRYQTINMLDKDNAVNGYITLAERTDTSFDVYMNINKTQMDKKYSFILFRGHTASAPTDTLINLGSVVSQTTGAAILAKAIAITAIKVDQTTTRKFNYDSVIAVNGFARISMVGSQNQDSTVSLVNIGKNN